MVDQSCKHCIRLGAACLLAVFVAVAFGPVSDVGAADGVLPSHLIGVSEDGGTVSVRGAEAVASGYEFSSTGGTYTEITGGTVHGSASNDDTNFAAVDLGFTFNYDGVDYTQVSIQSNGFVALGATVTSSYTPLSTGTSNNVVVALGRDIQGNGTTSELMSLAEGTAPNRVFTVQWKAYKRYGTAFAGDDLNFQIKLFETTGVIQVVYGAFTAVVNAAPPTVQVGLRGASNADFNNRMTDASHFWADSLPGTSNAAAMALTDTVFPASGLTYEWSVYDGVAIIPAAQSGSGCPGGAAGYAFEVVNSTAATASYNLSYSSLWPATGPAATGDILPYESEVVNVQVDVPWGAAVGESDVLTVTAEDAGATTSATATATTDVAVASGWQDLTSLAAGRGVRYHSVVYWDGKLYKIGGDNGAAQPWLDIYDIATDTWSAGADMPAARYYISCEAIAGKIYCAGGYSTSGQSTLYIYDIAGNSWSTGAALPAARYDYASAQLGGMYYVIGGYTTASQATMLAYDPATDTWDTTLPSMSVARRYAQSGVIGGKIYVAGGYSTVALASVEVYDPVANSWSPAASMPLAWVMAADGVIDDRFLIVVGGYNTTTTASSYALYYDAVNDSWGLLPTSLHMTYGSEGVGVGPDFWHASGRLYEGGAFSYSTYTTTLSPCEACVPVAGADFTVDPPSPNANTPATFTASVTTGSPTVSYSWDFGDGGTATGAVVEHTFTAAGTYTVVLTASNCGDASTDTISHPVDVPIPVELMRFSVE